MGITPKIYALSDPVSGIVRYVGKSNDPAKRLGAHMSSSDTRTRKRAWLSRLRSQGLRPTLIILEVCERRSWEDAERCWIAHYGEQLYNIDHGGRGTGRMADSTKRILAQRVRERGPLSITHKENISKNGKGSQHVDSGYRQRRRERTRDAWRDPAKRERLLLRNAARWSDPAQKERHRVKHTGAKRSVKTRRKISEAAKRRDPTTRKHSIATREKISLARKNYYTTLRVPLRAEREEGPNWGNLEVVK